MKPARLIIIDDPTEYADRLVERKDGKRTRRGRGVSSIYSKGVMSVQDLIDLGPSIRAISAADGYTFPWTTRPNAPMAIAIMTGRGMRYCQWPFTWRKLTATGKEFPGPGAYAFTNPEDVALTDWNEDYKDEEWEAEEVLLGRWKGQKLWHPNTGYKPFAFINAVHPRYPKTLDNEAWKLFPGVTAIHDPDSDEVDEWENPLAHCFCRQCVRGKIASSRKPEEFQDLLDKWFDPYLEGYSKVELFATRQRESRGSPNPWICLGYDVTGNDIREDLSSLALEMELG